MNKLLTTLMAVLALLCLQAAMLAEDKEAGQEPGQEAGQEPGQDAEEELSEAELNALATSTYFLLRDHCWYCHGQPGEVAFGRNSELDWILDYDRLVQHSIIVPGSARQSRLVRITLMGDMPRGFDDEGSPSRRPRMALDDVQTFIDWTSAGAPAWELPEFTHEWALLAKDPPLPDAAMLPAPGNSIAWITPEQIFRLEGDRRVPWMDNPLGGVPTAAARADDGAVWVAVDDNGKQQLHIWRDDEFTPAEAPPAEVADMQHLLLAPEGPVLIGRTGMAYTDGWQELPLPPGEILAAGVNEALELLVRHNGGVQVQRRTEAGWQTTGETLTDLPENVAATWCSHREAFVLAAGGRVISMREPTSPVAENVHMPDALGKLLAKEDGTLHAYDAGRGYTRTLTPWRK
jgi:hypothetical protein